MRKFRHYAFQVILSALGIGTATAIVFTFITVFKQISL